MSVMQIELAGHGTRAVLSGAPWHRGIRLVAVRAEGDRDGAEAEAVPLLLPALAGHHFYTGAWPPSGQSGTSEPHDRPGTLVRETAARAVWHQPPTPRTRVETRITYDIVGPGAVEARFETRSHAAAYPHGYVGVFWATVVPHGGQRGMHLLQPADSAGHAAGPGGGSGARVRWHYFQGSGDCWSCRENTVLGPAVPPAPHDAGHPPAYYLANANLRFALPVYVVRWRDLHYALEVDTPGVALTNVLCATAIGGPSHDLSWRLRPGEARAVRCRLTIGHWPGWTAIEERYRAWSGCPDPAFAVVHGATHGRPPPEPSGPPEPLAVPRSYEEPPDSGLALSRRLFETRGRALLARLGLLERCAVACVGGTSQNARLDDAASRDHAWGPHLTFVLPDDAGDAEAGRLREAVEAMPDEADGVGWIGYAGPTPRRTRVRGALPLLRELTGYETRPMADADWLPHLGRSRFLGRRWTERLFDAGQGEVFHDPGKRFTEEWRHWTGYPPPDVHRALLARSLFRAWNAGPEYNLARTLERGDRLAFAQCLARFVDEVMELAFCWNERYVPVFKWRAAHFRRLPIVPAAVRDGLDAIHAAPGAPAQLAEAAAVTRSIKALLRELYHLPPGADEPLSRYAHAARAEIRDAAVRSQCTLDW